MDIRTLGFLFATATLIFCFVAAVLWRLMPQERSLPTWIGASSLTFVAGVCVALNGVIPAGLSVVVGNALLVWAMGLVFLASRRLLSWPTGYFWDAGVALAALVSAVLFAVFLHNPHARILASGILTGPFLIGAAWTFWRGAKPLPDRTRPASRSGQRISERLTAVLLVTGGAFFVIRGVVLLGTTVNEDFEEAPDLLLAMPYAYGVLLSVWLSSVLTLHVSARLQRRLMAANDRAVAANRELQILSRTDPLTKLHNRLRLDEILESEINRSRRYGSALSVVMVDLDNFKTINDHHGHQVGDRVLVNVAKILRIGLRKTDSVGRWGGEEFLLILPHTDIGRAVDVAEKVRRALEESAFGDVSHVTASFGVSSFMPGDSCLRILARADEALYDAKRSGRNRVSALAADPRGRVATSGIPGDDWML